MKGIFLCESSSNFASVYAPAVIEKLRHMVCIEPILYTKSQVLNDPTIFIDTKFIFSTWGMPSFTQEEIQTYFPHLECVFYAAGSVQGFARPFLANGVKVFSAWAANAVPVAEYTVAQIILAGKDFYAQARLVSSKDWENAAKRRGEHIGNYKKRVGLIGCGMIGSMVAEMLKAYDIEVLVYDPFLSQDKAEKLHVKITSLQEIFTTCSVVSNHLANNKATQKMLTYDHFSCMPPYATFINTGRGAQVVEDDLVKALTEREDLTAILDVTDPEPSPLDHAFYTLPNCILTPHIAGSLGGEVVRMAEYMAEECCQYMNGETSRYQVTLGMLETMA